MISEFKKNNKMVIILLIRKLRLIDNTFLRDLNLIILLKSKNLVEEIFTCCQAVEFYIDS